MHLYLYLYHTTFHGPAHPKETTQQCTASVCIEPVKSPWGLISLSFTTKGFRSHIGEGRQACSQSSDAITPVVGRVFDDVCVSVESDVEIIFFCPFQSYSGVTKFRQGQFQEQFQKVISPRVVFKGGGSGIKPPPPKIFDMNFFSTHLFPLLLLAWFSLSTWWSSW